MNWLLLAGLILLVALVSGGVYLSKALKHMKTPPVNPSQGGQAGTAGATAAPATKPTKSEKTGFWGGLGKVAMWFVILVIALDMVSCAVTCSTPRPEVPDNGSVEGRDGYFHWQQRPQDMVGGQIPIAGDCQAHVQVDNSNIFQIVLSDNIGRVNHLLWKRSEPCGTWDEVASPDKGTWWLEKVGRREYRGWKTSSRFPGQNLSVTLTIR
jgi:hypothetical protein